MSKIPEHADSEPLAETPRAFHIRQYGERPGDFQMVSGWIAEHGETERFSEVLLPPIGLIVEDQGEPIAACWMYLAAGIGVAFLEWPVTRPGLTLKQSKAAIGGALGALEAIADEHDYEVLVATTSAALGRVLERSFDFHPIAERVQLIRKVN